METPPNIKVTGDVLAEIAGKKTTHLMEAVAAELTKQAPNYGVDTIKEWAHFLAQACHETDHFNTLREYASGGAYEGRKDLGNVRAGDGRLFRGRGIFQTTGRANYYRLGCCCGNPDRFCENPNLLEEPEHAVWAAFVFWDDHHFNDIAIRPDADKIQMKRKGLTIYVPPVEYISRRINGGTNGLAERIKFYQRGRPIINRLFEEAGIV